MNAAAVDKIVDKYNSDPSESLGILLELQEQEGYLPKETLRYLAGKLKLPVARLYRMATFYEALSLKPLGRHQFHVCTGTACHVRGAGHILDRLEQKLAIKPGEVTPDQNFGLKTVNCVGACALGPVVIVNGEYHGNISVAGADRLIEQYSDGKQGKHSDNGPGQEAGAGSGG